MQGSKGIAERRDVVVLPPWFGERVPLAELIEEGLEVLFHDDPYLTVREALGGRVDGKHLACRHVDPAVPRPALGRPTEERVLAGLDLPAVEEPYGARHEELVAPGDRAIEPRTARPGAFDETRVIPEHHTKHAQSTAGRDHALRHDGSDHRGIIAGTQRGDRIDRRRIFVAVRKVVEEIPAGADIHLREPLGTPGPDALQVLDRTGKQ